jgi:hypothetical protein
MAQKSLSANVVQGEFSRAPLDAALFEVPAGFTKVNFKADNPSFFRRLFSFIGQ